MIISDRHTSIISSGSSFLSSSPMIIVAKIDKYVKQILSSVDQEKISSKAPLNPFLHRLFLFTLTSSTILYAPLFQRHLHFQQKVHSSKQLCFRTLTKRTEPVYFQTSTTSHAFFLQTSWFTRKCSTTLDD